MWFDSIYLPSKLLDIPPSVVACLNPSFHARRGARCHLKDVTDAQLSPVRKHLDASVMKVCVKRYLRQERTWVCTLATLQTRRVKAMSGNTVGLLRLKVNKQYTVYQSFHICIFSTLSSSSFLFSAGVTKKKKENLKSSVFEALTLHTAEIFMYGNVMKYSEKNRSRWSCFFFFSLSKERTLE